MRAAGLLGVKWMKPTQNYKTLNRKNYDESIVLQTSASTGYLALIPDNTPLIEGWHWHLAVVVFSQNFHNNLLSKLQILTCWGPSCPKDQLQHHQWHLCICPSKHHPMTIFSPHHLWPSCFGLLLYNTTVLIQEWWILVIDRSQLTAQLMERTHWILST